MPTSSSLQTAAHNAMSARRVSPSADTLGDAHVAEAGGAAGDLLDEAAFHRLHGQSARALWSYLYRVVGDAARAEDMVQEAFLRILKAPIGALTDDERRAYLFRVAGNLAVDAFRQRKREGEILESVERESAHEVEPQVRDLDVSRSFEQLKPQERALLWLAYVEGSAHEDIARSLRLKTGSIKVLLFRARRRLRDLLTREGGPR